MPDLVTTSIKLEPKQAEWVEEQGRKFNFSEWVRDKIDEEITRQRGSSQS